MESDAEHAIAKLAVCSHRNAVRDAELTPELNETAKALSFGDTATKDLHEREDFQEYSRRLQEVVRWAYSYEGEVDQEKLVQKVSEVPPIALIDEDPRNDELFDLAMDGAEEKVKRRVLPHKIEEMNDDNKRRRMNQFLVEEFKYREKHEETQGFVRLDKLFDLLQPLNHKMKHGKKLECFGSALETVIEEFNEELCASHRVNYIIMMLALMNFERIWPVLLYYMTTDVGEKTTMKTISKEQKH